MQLDVNPDKFLVELEETDVSKIGRVNISSNMSNTVTVRRN